MGIISALIVTVIITTCSVEREKVFLTVARSLEPSGRCVDKEIFIENSSDIEASDITISFDVDYFTRRGDIAINYGDEKEQFITSAITTKLERREFLSIPHSLDEKNSVVSIPRLKPGQYLHLFYGGDTIYDLQSANKRDALIDSKSPELMNKPRVIDSSYKTGALSVDVVIECN